MLLPEQSFQSLSPRVQYMRVLQTLILFYHTFSLVVLTFISFLPQTNLFILGIFLSLISICAALWMKGNNLSCFLHLICYLLFITGYVTFWMGLYNIYGFSAGFILLCLHNGLLASTLLWWLSFYQPDCLVNFVTVTGSVLLTSIAAGFQLSFQLILSTEIASLLVGFCISRSSEIKQQVSGAAWEWDDEIYLLDACCIWWQIPRSHIRRCCC